MNDRPPVRVLCKLARVLKVHWTKLIIEDDAPVGASQ